MRDGEDLRPVDVIFFVHHGVGKAIEVVDAKAVLTTRPTLLVLDTEISYAFVLCKEGQRNHSAGVSGVVHGRVAEFSLGVGVDRVAHAILALTRPNASSPGAIATLPFRTSCRRRRARFIQAFEIHYATVGRVVKMTDNFWEMGDPVDPCYGGLWAACILSY